MLNKTRKLNQIPVSNKDEPRHYLRPFVSLDDIPFVVSRPGTPATPSNTPAEAVLLPEHEIGVSPSPK
jgi:hypothetical protein